MSSDYICACDTCRTWIWVVDIPRYIEALMDPTHPRHKVMHEKGSFGREQVNAYRCFIEKHMGHTTRFGIVRDPLADVMEEYEPDDLTKEADFRECLDEMPEETLRSKGTRYYVSASEAVESWEESE